ncbi:hypothetical protein F4810DRAFT_660840, partial [Camillea tinctor]
MFSLAVSYAKSFCISLSISACMVKWLIYLEPLYWISHYWFLLYLLHLQVLTVPVKFIPHLLHRFESSISV